MDKQARTGKKGLTSREAAGRSQTRQSTRRGAVLTWWVEYTRTADEAAAGAERPCGEGVKHGR